MHIQFFFFCVLPTAISDLSANKGFFVSPLRYQQHESCVYDFVFVVVSELSQLMRRLSYRAAFAHTKSALIPFSDTLAKDRLWGV